MEKICSFFLFRQLAELINQGGVKAQSDLPDAIEQELQRRAVRAYEQREEIVPSRERATAHYYAGAR